jgi:hypothetical protein
MYASDAPACGQVVVGKLWEFFSRSEKTTLMWLYSEIAF